MIEVLYLVSDLFMKVFQYMLSIDLGGLTVGIIILFFFTINVILRSFKGGSSNFNLQSYKSFSNGIKKGGK